MEMKRSEYERFIRQLRDRLVRIAYLDHTSLVHRDKVAIEVLEAELKLRNLPLIKYDDWDGVRFKNEDNTT